MKKVSLWEIYRIFFIIGTQLLGGGYVILPLLQKYIVKERSWISEEELIDYFAISQCIPGIIAGNISMFTGYKMRKTLGATSAILGIITPSFIAIILLANILTVVVENNAVQNAFWGIRVSVIILIFMTIKEMWTKSVNSKFTYTLFFMLFILLLLTDISPAIIIVSSAIISLTYFKIRSRNNA